MINNLDEPEPIEAADIKLGDRCSEIDVYAAIIEVPIYAEDENLDLGPCARADYVPEKARPSG